jgi:hypothetical protein
MKAESIIPDQFLALPSKMMNDKKLSSTDRLLLGFLISYDNGKGCYMKNSNLARYVGCSVGTISKSIAHLQELDYVISNEGSEDHGGRCNTRIVSQEMKIHKSGKSILNGSNVKKIKPVPKKPSHIIYKQDKLTNSEEISYDAEKKVVLQTIKSSDINKFEVFNNIKAAYQDQYNLSWDVGSIIGLCNVVNRLTKTYDNKFSHLSNYDDVLILIFQEIIKRPPAFFIDCLPQTFDFFWNKVIQQIKVRDKIKEISNKFNSNDEEQSFI